MMDLEKIQELINIVTRSNLAEFDLQQGNMQIKLVNQPKNVQNTTGYVHQADIEEETGINESEFKFITSPLVGVFKPLSANEKEAIKVGDNVNVGQAVCVVEAMKLINEIESEYAGEIVEILVNEGETVEYGQKLFKLRAN